MILILHFLHTNIHQIKKHTFNNFLIHLESSALYDYIHTVIDIMNIILWSWRGGYRTSIFLRGWFFEGNWKLVGIFTNARIFFITQPGVIKATKMLGLVYQYLFLYSETLYNLWVSSWKLLQHQNMNIYLLNIW